MSQPYDPTEDTFLPRSERLRILSTEEYQLLWGMPRFSQYDRELFFTLNAREKEILNRLRTLRTKANFLLQLGYFRARQRFFRFEQAQHFLSLHARVNNLFRYGRHLLRATNHRLFRERAFHVWQQIACA